MKTIYDCLISAKASCNITKNEHIKEIYEMKESINNNICPRCGGNLIEKAGKYGKFFGCENYPKCKFIKKSK
ncbi:MAG: topoisomerase DNA-binding C4 zinc finger domain-containing protein [Clostridia bacterium]